MSLRRTRRIRKNTYLISYIFHCRLSELKRISQLLSNVFAQKMLKGEMLIFIRLIWKQLRDSHESPQLAEKRARNFVIQSDFFQALSLKFQTARKNTCLAVLFYSSRATKRHMDRRKVQFSLVTPIHGDRWRNLPLFRKPLCRAL